MSFEHFYYRRFPSGLADEKIAFRRSASGTYVGRERERFGRIGSRNLEVATEESVGSEGEIRGKVSELVDWRVRFRTRIEEESQVPEYSTRNKVQLNLEREEGACSP